MKTYFFSYYKKTKTPVLVRRPWWNLTGRDAIEMREQWQRHCIADIPEDEAALLIKNEPDVITRLIYRLLAGAARVQIEVGQAGSSYVQTPGRVK